MGVMRECVIDEVERMKQICDLLRGGDPKEIFKDAESEVVDRISKLNTPDDHQQFKQDMLEYLHDLVENLDNAKAFMLVGGFEPVLQIVQAESKPAVERKESLEILGACAQNNPPCQKELDKLGVLPILLEILSKDSDSGVRLKALGAISSLCRGHSELEQKFITNDGVALLVNKLGADGDVKVKRKCLFFLRALFFSSPSSKDQACSGGLKKLLVGLIGHEDIDLRESCLNAMIELVTESKERTAAFNKTELRLRPMLEDRRSKLHAMAGEDLVNAQEEIQLCDKLQSMLLTTIFTSPAPTPTETAPFKPGSNILRSAEPGLDDGINSASNAEQPLLLKGKQ